MIYQVVEIVSQYIDGFDGDHEWEEEVDKGYYSTMDKAKVRLEILTKQFWSKEYNCCMRNFRINEIVLDKE